ncbi:hypothetical protein [Acinetobacter junii]|nr:hypothetical protein [Acinetobacter junii]
MILNEANINVSSIADVFNQAFMDISDIESDRFNIRGEQTTFRCIVDTKHKRIEFMDFTNAGDLAWHQLDKTINKLNEDLVFASFSLVKLDDGRLGVYSKHELTFERGIITYHIVAQARMFEKLICYAYDRLREAA